MTDDTALVVSNVSKADILVAMSEPEFKAKLQSFQLYRQRVEIVLKTMMKEGRDYGRVPGVAGDKPSLFKPGAEILASVFGLVARFAAERTYSDPGGSRPAIDIIVVCKLYHGGDGPLAGEGVGAANSWERKNRYRTASRACPNCGATKALTKSKYESGGWFCWDKKGGCGAKFADGDERITKQVLGTVENADPYDLENTIIKMAAKRAFIDAILRATGASFIFAQDLEDLVEHEEEAAITNGTKATSPAQVQAPAKPQAQKSPAQAPASKPEPKQEPRPETPKPEMSPSLADAWKRYNAIALDADSKGIKHVQPPENVTLEGLTAITSKLADMVAEGSK